MREVMTKSQYKYQQGKEKARQEAIDWQRDFTKTAHSYDDLAAATAYFEARAKRYGLMREFKENGIL